MPTILGEPIDDEHFKALGTEKNEPEPDVSITPVVGTEDMNPVVEFGDTVFYYGRTGFDSSSPLAPMPAIVRGFGARGGQLHLFVIKTSTVVFVNDVEYSFEAVEGTWHPR